jgi:hypothetical protein
MNHEKHEKHERFGADGNLSAAFVILVFFVVQKEAALLRGVRR